MPQAASDPSLEPLLRARASGAYSAPSNNLRTLGGGYSRRPQVYVDEARSSRTAAKDDFTDFLHSLGRLAISPVTVPLNLIHRALTSPLTLSLAIKLVLLGMLVLASAAFSIMAVGAFWWSWGTGGTIELEGWLTYGSRTVPTPHALIPLVSSKFQEDLRYDVHVELELVRPNKLAFEHNNFMLGLELRSAKNPDITLYTAAQPSLPPPPLLSSILPISPFSIPCLIPWPFTPLCPSRLLGFSEAPTSQAVLRRRRIAAGAGYSSINSRELVLLKKDLLDGVVPRPARGELSLGSAFVTIGREDAFDPASTSGSREVKTTGWVVVRFIPRPTGIRWLLSFHPIPPLLLLPPIALGLTLSSSLFAFVVITYLARPKQVKSKADTRGKEKGPAHAPSVGGSVEEQLLAERRARAFEERDAEDRREGERRQREWEELESLAAGGLRKMPMNRKRQPGGSTLLGGSETTAPTAISTAVTAPSGTSGSTSVSNPTTSTSNTRSLHRDTDHALSDSTSLSGEEEGDETDQEVRTESTYAPLGNTELRAMGRGGQSGDEGGRSESSDEWEEAR